MEATLDLARGDIGFSAAHFSVHDGRSERLHGHNYRVHLRIMGEVGADGTVVDFTRLKADLREVCAELDERMLVPLHSADVSVAVGDDSVELRAGARHFSLPRGDVVLLPIVNSTCECLAAYLLQRLSTRAAPGTRRLEVRVEETPGQGATVGNDVPGVG